MEAPCAVTGTATVRLALLFFHSSAYSDVIGACVIVISLKYIYFDVETFAHVPQCHRIKITLKYIYQIKINMSLEG